MSYAFSPDGEEFLYDTFSTDPLPVHTVHKSVAVDNGAIRIDHDDGLHLIHIAADLPSNKNYIEIENAAKNNSFFRVKNDGTTETKNLIVENTIVNTEYNQLKTDVATHGTTLTTNSSEIGENAANLVLLQADVAENVLDIGDRPLREEMIVEITEALTDAYGKISDIENELADATDEHSVAVPSVGKLIQHADELKLKEITCDKINCEEFDTTGSIELLADGALYFVPYFESGGVLVKEEHALFRFGRSETLGVNPAPDDGLLMSRRFAGVDHDVLLQVHPEVPNLHITSTKNANQPYIQCSTSNGSPRFSFTDAGGIVSKGMHTSDFSELPDSFVGSSIHNSHSVYIGNSRLSFNDATNKLEIHTLKINTIPLVLQGSPYNFTVGDIDFGTQNTVQQWMIKARQQYTPVNHSLRVDEVFPFANVNTDFNEQVSGGSSNPLEIHNATGSASLSLESNTDVAGATTKITMKAESSVATEDRTYELKTDVNNSDHLIITCTTNQNGTKEGFRFSPAGQVSFAGTGSPITNMNAADFQVRMDAWFRSTLKTSGLLTCDLGISIPTGQTLLLNNVDQLAKIASLESQVAALGGGSVLEITAANNPGLQKNNWAVLSDINYINLAAGGNISYRVPSAPSNGDKVIISFVNDAHNPNFNLGTADKTFNYFSDGLYMANDMITFRNPSDMYQIVAEYVFDKWKVTLDGSNTYNRTVNINATYSDAAPLVLHSHHKMYWIILGDGTDITQHAWYNANTAGFTVNLPVFPPDGCIVRMRTMSSKNSSASGEVLRAKIDLFGGRKFVNYFGQTLTTNPTYFNVQSNIYGTRLTEFHFSKGLNVWVAHQVTN